MEYVLIKSKQVEMEHQQATDQQTNMANQSKEQQSADQVEPTLNMNCSTRDQLILTLSQLSNILQYNKPI